MAAVRADQRDTDPGTPHAINVAEEVKTASAELRWGNLKASIPGALIIALVTSLTTVGAVRYSPGAGNAPEAAQKQEKIEERLRDLADTQHQMLETLNRMADDSRNERALQKLDRAELERRLGAVERNR